MSNHEYGAMDQWRHFSKILGVDPSGDYSYSSNRRTESEQRTFPAKTLPPIGQQGP